jgi:hypothetical protein
MSPGQQNQTQESLNRIFAILFAINTRAKLLAGYLRRIASFFRSPAQHSSAPVANT